MRMTLNEIKCLAEVPAHWYLKEVYPVDEEGRATEGPLSQGALYADKGEKFSLLFDDGRQFHRVKVTV